MWQICELKVELNVNVVLSKRKNNWQLNLFNRESELKVIIEREFKKSDFVSQNKTKIHSHEKNLAVKKSYELVGSIFSVVLIGYNSMTQLYCRSPHIYLCCEFLLDIAIFLFASIFSWFISSHEFRWVSQFLYQNHFCVEFQWILWKNIAEEEEWTVFYELLNIDAWYLRSQICVLLSFDFNLRHSKFCEKMTRYAKRENN